MKLKKLISLINNKQELTENIKFYLEKQTLSKIERNIFEIKGHLNKAQHNLEFINDLNEEKYPDWILVGCYYAIYQSALALLINKGFFSKNHDATLCVLIKEYLKKENRPQRHGKNYYYSLMENKATNREVFGIYGNQYEEKGDITINIYDNNRIGITLDNSTNKISKSDNEILKEIAANFKPKLITIFNKETAYIKKTYQITGYENEISFEEFFIWWYHFIYT